MGAQLPIYTLYRYDSTSGCDHELLVRVQQPAASNADEGAVDAASAFAESAATHLRGWWEQWYLRPRCAHDHRARLVGEMQVSPVGEELYGPGLRDVQLWLADTRYGTPWVILGTAADETAFWTEVEDDPDLCGLEPKRPARRRSAFFLTDRDGENDLSYP